MAGRGVRNLPSAHHPLSQNRLVLVRTKVRTLAAMGKLIRRGGCRPGDSPSFLPRTRPHIFPAW